MRTASAIAVFTFLALLLDCAPGSAASGSCAEEQASQVPTDLELCAALAPIVRKPSALPLNEYQPKLGEYLRNYCHRDERSGWKVDKRVRDTGPWVGSYVNGRWTGNYFGTHAPALVWYSPEMYAWLKVNRPSEGAQPPTQTQPIPDGAIIVKEMYRPPAAACAHVDSLRLNPDKEGAAIMIRDSRASHDGWFWGWFGWSDWQPDWPQRAQNRDYPFMGFGQYCTNCHASAKEYTFSSLKNIKGESGEPLVFFSQNFFLDPSWQSLQGPITQSGATTQSRSVRRRDPPWQSLQSRIAQSEVKAQPGPPEGHYSPDFVRTFSWWGGWPNGDAIVKMPSVSYDHVWVKAPPPTATSQFVTSDQCLGCHSAGGTGLQYDMTVPGPENKLINLSPYGTWSGSPMRLAGRDPVFFAQLASERETFHPRSVPMIDDTCLGCHGVQGQRQFVIDRHAATGTCETIDREMVNAIPYPPGDPVSRLAKYGALARDGVSCASCHRMIVGKADIDKHRPEPQNKCVEERQAALNPGLSGFAKTFTGTFFVGPPDQFYGQFQDPKKKSMHAAIGSNPIHSSTVSSSEMCGSCHTVHLPVLHRGHKIGHFYEQTTYPEWAFSDYRTGATPDGALPLGAESKAQSCPACHMPNKDVHGNSYRSKIAAIQEYTNFPQAEHTLDPKDLDLAERAGLATHTLVGLNIFLLKMASQFPDILGLRRTDPMMSDLGIDPLIYSQQVVLEQAAERTASISFDEIKTEEGVLSARVKVDNRAGHKFPSGVALKPGW